METKPLFIKAHSQGLGMDCNPKKDIPTPPNSYRLHLSNSSPEKIQKDTSNQSSTNGSDEGFLIIKMCNSTLSYIWNIPRNRILFPESSKNFFSEYFLKQCLW